MIHSLTISVRDNAAPQGELFVIWDRFDGDRPGFQYSIDAVFPNAADGKLVDRETLAYGHDLWLAAGDSPNHVEAMKTLVTFLLADAETYANAMTRALPFSQVEFSFNEKTAEWAYGLSEELESVRQDLGYEEPETGMFDARCEQCGEPIDHCQGHGEIAEAVASGRPLDEVVLLSPGQMATKERHGFEVADYELLPESVVDGLGTDVVMLATRAVGTIDVGDHVIVDIHGKPSWINIGPAEPVVTDDSCPDCGNATGEDCHCAGFVSTPKAITVFQLAVYRLGLEDGENELNGQHFADAGLPMMGGCEVCGATVAAYNACPSRTGHLRCASGCIRSDGYSTVENANAAIFDGELPVRARALQGNVHTEEEGR